MGKQVGSQTGKQGQACRQTGKQGQVCRQAGKQICMQLSKKAGRQKGR